MGSPNGGSSNNFGSFAGVISALNETNKKLRSLIDILCCQNNTSGAAGSYNKVNHHLVNQGSGPLTVPANTVHSISYVVLNGTLAVSINGNAITCPAAYSSSVSVSGLIESQYIFTPVDGSSSGIIITTSA